MGSNPKTEFNVKFLLLTCFFILGIIISNILVVLNEKLTNNPTNPPTLIGLYFFFLLFVFPTQILKLLVIYFAYYLFTKYFLINFFHWRKKYFLFIFCSLFLGVMYSVLMHVLFVKVSDGSNNISTKSLLKNLDSIFFYFSLTSTILITILWTIALKRIQRQ